MLNEKIDKKTEAALIGALERAKAFSQQLQENREQRFWKAIVKNSGIIPDKGISASNAESLMGFSIIFPGLYDNQKVLFVPAELVRIFSQIDGIELENIVHRNTEWIRLTHGLLYYYGVMDAWLIKEKVKKLIGQEIDILEFMDVMSFACDFYGQARYTPYGYQDDRVFDAKKIVEEHRMRSGVDYSIPSELDGVSVV